MLPGNEGGSIQPRERLVTLGFLGNISADKGIFEFLDVLSRLRDLGYDLKGKIAGPFQEAKTEQSVMLRVEQASNAQYIGPVYGDDKSEFFRSIDVLLFPTRYSNEAEPLTMHEALMHGVPVIAYGRGSIGEVIADGAGIVIDPECNFVDEAVRQIESWVNGPLSLKQASVAASKRSSQYRDVAARECAALVLEICPNSNGR
jgi:glycosyltransferase involved in cell wall biosynthesis